MYFLLVKAYLEADFLGRCIFFALFLLSVLSWIALLYTIWLSVQFKKSASAFSHLIEQQKEKPLQLQIPKGAAKAAIDNPSFAVYQVIKEKTCEILEKNRFFTEQEGKGLIYLSDSDMTLVSTQAVSALNRAIKPLEKYLFLLPTAVSLGPFLGLLGTVWGILLTFHQLHTSSMPKAALLSGLSTALATTVIGLLVAIPALISYQYIKSALEERRKDLEHFASMLLATIELCYRKNR